MKTKIKTLPNGFLETIGNLESENKVIFLRDAPIVENNFKFKKEKQVPKVIIQEPKKSNSFFDRRKAKLEERYRVKALEEQKRTNELLLNLIQSNNSSSHSPSPSGSLFPFLGKQLAKLFKPKNLLKLFKVGTIITAVKYAYNKLGKPIIEDFKERASRYEEYRAELGKEKATATQKAFAYIGSLYSDVSKWASEKTDGWMGSVSEREAWDGIESIQKSIGDTWNNVTDWLEIKMKGLEVWSLSDFVPNDMKEWYKDKTKAISDTWDNILDWFDIKTNEIQDWLQSIKESVRGQLERVKDYMFGTDLENAQQKVKDLKEDIATKGRGGLDDRIKSKFLGSIEELKADLVEAESELAKAYKEAISKTNRTIKENQIIANYERANMTKEEKTQLEILLKKLDTAKRARDANEATKKFTTNDEAIKVLNSNISKNNSTIEALTKEINKLSPPPPPTKAKPTSSMRDLFAKLKEAKKQKYINSLAHIETGSGRYKNPYSIKNKYGYVGRYQFGKSTATPYLKKLGKQWKDFRGNKNIQEQVIRMFTDDNIAQLKKLVKDRPITSLDKWIAHNQGMGGYKSIMLNTDQKPSRAILRNMKSNVPSSLKKGLTKQVYIDYWKTRLQTDNVPANDKQDEVISGLKELITQLKSKDKKEETPILFVDESSQI